MVRDASQTNSETCSRGNEYFVKKKSSVCLSERRNYVVLDHSLFCGTHWYHRLGVSLYEPRHSLWLWSSLKLVAVE